MPLSLLPARPQQYIVMLPTPEATGAVQLNVNVLVPVPRPVFVLCTILLFTPDNFIWVAVVMFANVPPFTFAEVSASKPKPKMVEPVLATVTEME